MIDLLKTLGKKYFAYCYDPLPYQFNFLPYIEKISPDKSQLQFKKYDLIIILDCGQMSRTKLVGEITSKNNTQYIIEFDHHPQVHGYADLEIRLPEYSSTTEILYCFFATNKIKINKNLANCILTGILTDTGNLLYESTSDDTVKIASRMLLSGASYPSVLEHTSRNKSITAMKIWGKALGNLTINSTYNFAYSILDSSDLAESKTTEEELEGIAGFLSNLRNVKGLLLLREEEQGKIKGSLRTSHPDIDISKLALKLGGGGHARASGFVIKGQLEKTRGGWKIK
jgi:phosphoesterase RecJ-like protein